MRTETYKYHAISERVHKLNMINLSLNESIDSYWSAIEDTTEEELRSLFLDFLLTTRQNANALFEETKAISNTGEMLLNASRTPNSHTSPFYDDALKKELLSIRY